MAKKDWRKTGKDFWERTSIKGNIFRGKLGTDKLGIVEAYNPQKKEYSDFKVVVLVSGGSSIESKNFKSKPQALKYAKAYMRKH